MKPSWQISKSFCLLLYMLLLSGCVILPYPATLTPAVVGTVHGHGQPVENAKVSVVRYEPCDELVVALRLDPGDELVGLHGTPDLHARWASKAHALDGVAVTEITYAGAGIRGHMEP